MISLLSERDGSVEIKSEDMEIKSEGPVEARDGLGNIPEYSELNDPYGQQSDEAAQAQARSRSIWDLDRPILSAVAKIFVQEHKEQYLAWRVNSKQDREDARADLKQAAKKFEFLAGQLYPHLPTMAERFYRGTASIDKMQEDFRRVDSKEWFPLAATLNREKRPAELCSHCRKKGHNQDRCRLIHPEIAPEGMRKMYIAREAKFAKMKEAKRKRKGNARMNKVARKRMEDGESTESEEDRLDEAEEIRQIRQLMMKTKAAVEKWRQKVHRMTKVDEPQ